MSDVFKVLSPDGISAEGVDLLGDHPRFTINAEKLKGDALAEAIADADALIVRSGTKVTGDLLARAPKLKAVARAGVGVDNIDLGACTRAGVLVMNTPDGNTVSAAEHTLALIMACSRHVASADAHMRDAKWERKKFLGSELRGKTLGVVGLGKIGRRVASFGQGLEMDVIAFDPVVSDEAAQKMGVERAELNDVLRRADVLTLHVPKNEHTANLVRSETIATMKDGVRIVNCSRGGVVNEADLAEALRSGKVAAAGLDVFAQEPPEQGSPLFDAPNLTVTPHLGASTREAQESVGIDAASQIRDYLLKGSVRNAVNAPAIDPADAEVLEPFADLGRRLGSIHAHLLDGGLKRMAITFAGPTFEGRDRTVLTRACLEGFFRHYQSQPVNFINVAHFAEENGIALEESTTSERRGYVNLITVEVETAGGTRSIGGAIFGQASPRLVHFDQYQMDAIPEGHAIVFANDDRPGMLGAVSSVLGNATLNIANVSLGRDKPSGTALTYLNLDGEPTPELVECLKNLDGIRWLKALTFDA